jgi:hypothetical protein
VPCDYLFPFFATVDCAFLRTLYSVLTIGAQIFFDLDFHLPAVTNKSPSNKGIRDTREPGRNALPAPA